MHAASALLLQRTFNMINGISLQARITFDALETITADAASEWHFECLLIEWLRFIFNFKLKITSKWLMKKTTKLWRSKCAWSVHQHVSVLDKQNDSLSGISDSEWRSEGKKQQKQQQHKTQAWNLNNGFALCTDLVVHCSNLCVQIEINLSNEKQAF